MNRVNSGISPIIYFLILIIMVSFAVWMKNLDIKYEWQHTGFINFSLGFVLLAAYATANLLKTIKLPMISGYIFSGIIAGPYITGFLDSEMVGKLRLIDDLALSFIAMSAGGALYLEGLKKQTKAICINIALLTIIVSGLVFLFVVLAGQLFNITNELSQKQVIVFALLLGVIAIARSPSSAIAIISECKASGSFTEIVLGVTIAMDVLIIVFFTIALTGTKIILSGTQFIDFYVFIILLAEISASFFIGFVIGKIIAFYIKSAGFHLPLFLLFLAFSITKSCMGFNSFMQNSFNLHLNLEPLLICMSAGFTVQNFSQTGHNFNESLERISLPIFLLFFSIAGAALNIESLRICWPLAISLFFVRGAGIFIATWTSAVLNKAPVTHRKYAWMAYLTQAGVAIGLAQLAQRHSPEIGVYLTTVVLAVITLNQVAGPITFKIALNLVGDAGRKKNLQ